MGSDEMMIMMMIAFLSVCSSFVARSGGGGSG